MSESQVDEYRESQSGRIGILSGSTSFWRGFQRPSNFSYLTSIDSGRNAVVNSEGKLTWKNGTALKRKSLR